MHHTNGGLLLQDNVFTPVDCIEQMRTPAERQKRKCADKRRMR